MHQSWKDEFVKDDRDRLIEVTFTAKGSNFFIVKSCFHNRRWPRSVEQPD